MSNSYASLVSTLTTRASLTPGAFKDLSKCFNAKSQYHFAESTMLQGEKYGVDFNELFTFPQKQIFRAIGFINALVSGTPSDFDYTHARIICAARLAQSYDLHTDAIAALAAGIINPVANTRGITSSAVNRLFSQSHKLSTVHTKISNMTGKNGFAQLFGITHAIPGEQNHAITLNHDSAMVKRFFSIIDNASMGQIDAMNEKGAKSE